MTANDPDGFPPFDPDRAATAPASLAACTSAADVLDYLCAQKQGSYTRRRMPDRQVQIRFKVPDGTVYGVIDRLDIDCALELAKRVGVTT